MLLRWIWEAALILLFVTALLSLFACGQNLPNDSRAPEETGLAPIPIPLTPNPLPLIPLPLNPFCDELRLAARDLSGVCRALPNSTIGALEVL